jgi:hypothetical protein
MSKQSEKSGNKQVGSIAEVGLMAGFGRKKSVLNPQLFEELSKKEIERLISLWKSGLEHQYVKLAKTFKLRFQEDPTIFEGIDPAEVFTIFEQMARHLLLFSPSKISADVTFDKSVILQSHYESFRVYWETFIPEDQEEPYYSTLNIYADQSLIFTGGGKAEEMIAEFVRVMPPLFEKMPPAQIL